MKLSPQSFSTIVAGITCLAVPVFAATEAMTDPVGFVTLAVQGGGSLSSPKLSLVSPTLIRPVEWQGPILTISGNTITVAGTPWTAGQFNGANGSYFVEVVSASNPGALSDITLTTTNSITTSDSLSTFGAVGDSIRVRKHVTIADVFGTANTAGLLASDDASTADEVLVYDGAASTSYFYFTGAPGFPAGWYDSGFLLNPGDAEKVVIGPHQGVVIKRKAGGTVSFVSSGSVKTGNTLLPIVNGLNVLGTVSAKGLTLATSGLYTGSPTTGVKPSDDSSTADEVTIYTPSGQTSYFYYTGSPGFPAGWYDSGFLLEPGIADSIAIPPGTAFVLSRKGGPAFNWALPSPATF